MMKLIVTSVLLTLSLAGFSQNYYVSTTGNDANNGLSTATAWRTIQYAVDHISAGATVNILGGVYNEKVEILASGTSANPITLKNYNASPAIIDGTGTTAALDALIAIIDQDHIIIEGLVIRNNIKNEAQGILIEGDCQGITIRNNEIYHISYADTVDMTPCPDKNSQPLVVNGTKSNAIADLLIENNIIKDCNVGCSEGLAINGYVDRFDIKRNTVFNISNSGIGIIGGQGVGPAGSDFARGGFVLHNEVYNCKAPYATAAGIYVDGASDIFIESNKLYDNQWGIELACETVGFVSRLLTVQNNFIYNNDDAGLAVGGYDYPSGSGMVSLSSIVNNTLYDNDKQLGGVGGSTGDMYLTYTEFTTIANNIILSTNERNLILYEDNANSLGLVMDHNLYYAMTNPSNPEWNFGGSSYTSLTDFQSSTALDVNSIYADPQLVDLSTFDVHLDSTSPAIDAGLTSYFSGSMDFDGDVRPLFSSIDMGADEFSGTVVPRDINFQVSAFCIEMLHDPTPEFITVDGTFTDATIDILNSSFIPVQSIGNSNGPITIDLSTLAPGRHYINIFSNTYPDLNILQIIK